MGKESKMIKRKDNNIESKTNYNKRSIYGKNINNKKIIENNELNIKIDSFLQDISKEEIEKDILFEDLLKTYSEESNKENESNENNEIIGDEKTFFNNSKIPKIEEFKFVQNNISQNENKINNLIASENMTSSRRNSSKEIKKHNFTNIFDRLHNKIKSNRIDYDYEFNFLNNLKIKRNEKINSENKLYEKFMKEKKLLSNNNNEEYHRNRNKEKMYNFIFNEKIDSFPYKRELKLDIIENSHNNVNSIMNKLNTEIKTSSNVNLYNNYNLNQNKKNNIDIKYKSNRKNKSFKNSYSKYYLNKLEIENKYLIPQLNKKNFDNFY